MPTTPPEQNVLAKTMIYWPMRRLLSHSSCDHGFAPALRISSVFHAATIILLAATAVMTNLGWVAYAGIAIVASILYWEHRLLTPNDLSRINVAFFNLNGYVSILLLLTFAGDILIR